MKKEAGDRTYLTFQKAFEKVTHKKLLKKLGHLGGERESSLVD